MHSPTLLCMMQLDTQPQSLTQKELQSKQTGQMFAVMQTLQPSVTATAAANLLHMFPAHITLRRTFLPAARPSTITAAATAADTTLDGSPAQASWMIACTVSLTASLSPLLTTFMATSPSPLMPNDNLQQKHQHTGARKRLSRHNRFLAWLALAAILMVLPYLVNPV